ncbi:Gfo/Idh/MocA family oxidoreductase [Kribbella sandramycini]|uniref:Gfo/Idh/MocA family oxidoreductase n=1 Tax=Kribbella sandramycini TaxID=60450 RepID=A0A7Y4NYD0_9ACTN|nr:bi-domain-containing oxidoreductase [Kribbella sandramycini]MBB6568403.1 putative dehydrogenase/threonine dehydrogenase-like Zn-dependent dehydrogenase [Kribbella sandramycini]NOL39005.1 Gfo/Idh/MocA family oxidoreductase [Kribbella sandramycini]
MKQVAQNYKSGELAVLDVPPPGCRPGGVLVRSLYSLISTGTELMKVGEAKLSLVGKAKARPDQVKKVLDTVAQQGLRNTYQKVMNKLDSYTPLGYSLCGVVVEVGAGAEEFSVGQLVAAAGNEFALHAEYNWVPVNLCVPVPDGVRPEEAAFSTVGAIAMQGVRQAEVQLGETAVVIGLGLVGQLCVRLLVAAGVRVFGIDTVEDRCRMAEKAGALHCSSPDDVAALERSLLAASNGLGADHILLAAGGSSNGPVETAARLARDRARIVDIGKTKLDLPWNAYYDKELDLRFSRSYGPGRYDDRYELQGIDYPAGYVRWTERRNLECFVDLIAREQIDIGSLIAATFPIADATDAYSKLSTGSVPGVGFLFEYPDVPLEQAKQVAPRVEQPGKSTSGAVRLGFVGAGNYASSMLLPHLQGNDDAVLARVATNKSLSAANAQRKFGFEAISTDADEVLGDESLDAIFVVTRHSTHAELTCRALEAGKAVFVEKPLALTTDEVDRIVATVEATGNDRLMVGFNRRFAPLLTDLRQRFGDPGGNSSLRYLVNAGKLDPSSWYLDQGKEGSRFAGEGGHFIDTLAWWLDSTPTEVYAVPGPDAGDVVVTLRFANGSVGTISYVGGGNARFPKETIDITGGGRNARLDNFGSASVWSGRKPATRKARGTDKGQRVELERFVQAVKTGSPMPISFDSLIATTRATIAVDRSLASGAPEKV